MGTPRRQPACWGRSALAAAVVGAWLAWPATAHADRIILRGGGKIPGKLLPDPAKPGGVLVIMERGKTPLRLQKSQVVEVVPEPGPLDEYLTRRASAPTTASGQYDLGAWCDQHKLPDLAELHYEAALAADKAFAPAHQKLGHVQVNGVWLAGDQLREAQGLVKFKGKWITRDEKEQREQDGALAAEHSAWAKRIRAWRESIVYGPDDRRREAEAQFMSIREAEAVDPLVRVLGRDREELRGLLAKVLGVIPGPKAATAMVRLLVNEDEAEVRGTLLEELKRREEPEVLSTLNAALRASDPAIVNRAGWAISNLGAKSAVPNLVNALLTNVTRMEFVPDNGNTPGTGAAITATFGEGAPLMGMGYAAGGYPTAPIAYNGSSVGYLTGPVVGPGVAAFGATSAPVVPLPSSPLPLGTSDFGGGLPAVGLPSVGPPIAANPGGSRGPIPRPVTYTFRNTEVLAALVKLTAEDFGYDTAAWKRWLRTEFRPEPVPARRVPQP